MKLRYFVVNKNSYVMHVHGICHQTKPRDVAIRLFESPEELSVYTGRKLRLCEVCKKELNNMRGID